ncbi:hypothetical protein ACFLZG_03675 [Thermodesulfobacteriota bacterium]
MERKELSSELRILAKWCAILSIIIVIYPEIFLVQFGEPPYEMMSYEAKSITHSHLGCGTFLLFIVGYFFTYSSFDRAKKIWPTIGAISIIIMSFGTFFGLIPLLFIGSLVFTISIIVMSIGILGWV